jgi:hypothetical protein
LTWIVENKSNLLMTSIITIHIFTCHLLTSFNMLLYTTLGISLTFYNTGKFKQLHDIIIIFSRPCTRNYMQVQHIIYLFIYFTHTMFEVIIAKPQLIFHIIGGETPILRTFVYWSRDVVCASSDFNNAQNPCMDMHCPTSFGGVGWQSHNVPLGNMTVCLQMNVV